ncbi:MAG TPA: formyltransferase family protein [Thermoanaerobaculia bacterium]|nr:formyltransferase family protein [Thermoanaerobaculia bacterium]
MTRFALVTSHEFGRRALEGVLSSDPALTGELEWTLGVGLRRDGPSASVGYASVEEIAESSSVPYLACSDGTLAEVAEALKEAAPHYVLVIGWSRLVCAEVLELPHSLYAANGESRNSPGWGCIGMHPTKLPRGRGRAPLPWTILKGLGESALSTFFLEDGPDCGAVIRQQGFEIRPRETVTALFMRVSALHYEAGLLLAEEMAARKVSAVPQDEAAATSWPKRTPDDARLASFVDAQALIRLIRAQAWPYPTAFVEIGGTRLRLLAARTLRPAERGQTPGRILNLHGNELQVVVGSDIVALVLHPKDVGVASTCVGMTIPSSMTV